LNYRGAAALLAATVVNLPFGTLYAFSVFLKPMEALLDATRAEMGFVFWLATVTLTVGMNFAPQLYRRLSPVTLALACDASRGGRGDGLTIWLNVRIPHGRVHHHLEGSDHRPGRNPGFRARQTGYSPRLVGDARRHHHRQGKDQVHPGHGRHAQSPEGQACEC
jgi:hypothetical protein